MRCTAIRRKLTEYVYGDLTERESRDIRTHLVSCADCRDTASEIRGVLSLASCYEDKSPPVDILAGLKEKVLRRSESGRFKLSMFLKPIPAYAAATAIAVLAVVSGIGTRMEVARLERMNSLLSDSLRILNSQSLGAPLSDLSDSANQDTVPATTSPDDQR